MVWRLPSDRFDPGWQARADQRLEGAPRRNFRARDPQTARVVGYPHEGVAIDLTPAPRNVRVATLPIASSEESDCLERHHS